MSATGSAGRPPNAAGWVCVPTAGSAGLPARTSALAHPLPLSGKRAVGSMGRTRGRRGGGFAPASFTRTKQLNASGEPANRPGGSSCDYLRTYEEVIVCKGQS